MLELKKDYLDLKIKIVDYIEDNSDEELFEEQYKNYFVDMESKIDRIINAITKLYNEKINNDNFNENTDIFLLGENEDAIYRKYNERYSKLKESYKIIYKDVNQKVHEYEKSTNNGTIKTKFNVEKTKDLLQFCGTKTVEYTKPIVSKTKKVLFQKNLSKTDDFIQKYYNSENFKNKMKKLHDTYFKANFPDTKYDKNGREIPKKQLSGVKWGAVKRYEKVISKMSKRKELPSVAPMRSLFAKDLNDIKTVLVYLFTCLPFGFHLFFTFWVLLIFSGSSFILNFLNFLFIMMMMLVLGALEFNLRTKRIVNDGTVRISQAYKIVDEVILSGFKYLYKSSNFDGVKKEEITLFYLTNKDDFIKSYSEFFVKEFGSEAQVKPLYISALTGNFNSSNSYGSNNSGYDNFGGSSSFDDFGGSGYSDDFSDSDYLNFGDDYSENDIFEQVDEGDVDNPQFEIWREFLKNEFPKQYEKCPKVPTFQKDYADTEIHIIQQNDITDKQLYAKAHMIERMFKKIIYKIHSDYNGNISELAVEFLDEKYIKSYNFDETETTTDFDDCRFEIGRNPRGEAVYWEMSSKGTTPHGLVCGGTGSGKTIVQYNLTRQAIEKDYAVYFLDFKNKNGFGDFEDYGYQVYGNNELEDALEFVNNLTAEMDKRAEIFKTYAKGCKDLNSYHKAYKKDNSIPFLPRILVIVDEFGYLASTKSDISLEILNKIEIILQQSRQSGIHILVGLQKPLSESFGKTGRDNIAVKIVGKIESESMITTFLGKEYVEKVRRLPVKPYVENGVTKYPNGHFYLGLGDETEFIRSPFEDENYFMEERLSGYGENKYKDYILGECRFKGDKPNLDELELNIAD